MKSQTLLQIRGLKTYFFTERGVVKAVDDVDLELFKGEVLGLVGESGCGKSTVAFSILRLVQRPGRIIQGEILFNNENLLKKNENEMRKVRGANISMIFQDPMSSLNPVYTVGNQVAEVVYLHHDIKKKNVVVQKVIQMFEKVGLPAPERMYSHYPHEFSGGMRQRVMIAMALSCNAELLIADEPTTALDATIQAQILQLMKDLRKEFDSSILLITHDLGVIAELSDRIAVMYAGKIVEYSDAMTIFKKAKHPYTQALLRSVPGIVARKSRLAVIPGFVPDLINPPAGCRFHPRCNFCVETCLEKEPPMVEIEKGHKVSCFRVQEIDRNA